MKIDNATAAKLLRVLLDTVEAQQDEIEELAQMVKDAETRADQNKPGRAYRKEAVEA